MFKIPALLIAFTFLAHGADFRPPAVPLVTHDPYFSIWSMSDHLTDEPTKHWTGKEQSLASLVRIDGKVYRIMGRDPSSIPALEQTHLSVLPTHTEYQFAGDGVQVELIFLTPAIPDDLDLLSRPATYLTWRVRSTDSRTHQVSIYFDASSQIAVNSAEEATVVARHKLAGADVLSAGSQQQPILAKSGDDLRIDWGHLYVVVPASNEVSTVTSTRRAAMTSFSGGGTLPDSDDLSSWRPYGQPARVLAVAFHDFQATQDGVERQVVIAYDDEFSVSYLGRWLRPYWRRNGQGAAEMLSAALRDYKVAEEKSKHFDDEVTADARTAGGASYAMLCSLAYRQALAAHKLVADVDGTPFYFSKENFSNGSIDTVDVTYPSSPFFLLFAPTLLKGQLQPILEYSSLPRWRFPFAPHDLGRYPLADGQQYGGGEQTEENQMPVEETGNMLLMLSALDKFGGDSSLTKAYWPLISRWAEYLKSKGLDPENQLCTDDFAGHLAHNANLSIKAILALAAYGKMAQTQGDHAKAQQYGSLAKEYARKWMDMDREQDHFRLAFNQNNTWSQKYNLVWDHLLDLDVFPSEVVKNELAYYPAKQHKYGVPLDNRAAYTKLDWLAWTASLSSSEQSFENLFVAPAYQFANETSSRVPLTDWYDTETGKQVGFQARSVVGGIFIRFLDDKQLVKHYR